MRVYEACSWAAPWAVRAFRIGVEINNLDAALWLAVTVATLPWAIMQARETHLGQEQAAPFAARRQTGAAVAPDLEGQRLLFAVCVTEDVWAEFAAIAVLETNDLLLRAQRLFEQFTGRAGHTRLFNDGRSRRNP